MLRSGVYYIPVTNKIVKLSNVEAYQIIVGSYKEFFYITTFEDSNGVFPKTLIKESGLNSLVRLGIL